jgi:hypothetical protein
MSVVNVIKFESDVATLYLEKEVVIKILERKAVLHHFTVYQW